jgi:hypothetical protein
VSATTEPAPVGGGLEMAEWPAPGLLHRMHSERNAAATQAAAPPATAGSSV